MAEHPAGHDAVLSEQTAMPPGDLPTMVDLHIVSPSSSVPRGLIIQLSASSSIKHLKEKIRASLPTTPADTSQRLIHRGRLLAREEETLTNIFGAEAVCFQYEILRAN